MSDMTVVMVGMGQLGRIFAGAFLRAGYTVVPVNREGSMALAALSVPDPALVMVAVGENDLNAVLAAFPAQWKSRVGLIQNELLPRDWLRDQIVQPTVIPVWFEKKKGMDAKPLLPSPVFGPAAGLVVSALNDIDIPSYALSGEADLLYELVRKNVYILTTNIAGMKTGGNVWQLWEDHRGIATSVAEEVMDIQDWLTGLGHDRERLMRGMVEAFEADPVHQCMGRSAPGRLARALAYADEAGLSVPVLREIAQTALA